MVAKDEICLNSAISACTQCAAWQHALGLSLQTTSSCPNGIIWGAIVRAMPEQEAAEHTRRLRRQWQKCGHTDDQDLPESWLLGPSLTSLIHMQVVFRSATQSRIVEHGRTSAFSDVVSSPQGKSMIVA